MKKYIRFFMALALCLSLNITASAAEYRRINFEDLANGIEFSDAYTGEATSWTLKSSEGEQTIQVVPLFLKPGSQVSGVMEYIACKKDGSNTLVNPYDNKGFFIIDKIADDIGVQHEHGGLANKDNVILIHAQEHIYSQNYVGDWFYYWLQLDTNGEAQTTQPTIPTEPTTPSQPTTPAEPTVGDFNDVLASAYYADAVKWAVDKGVTNGTSETTFSPDEVCTRAQAMTCLWRANGSPEPVTASNPFTDIAESDYYYQAVLWAVANGITNGVSDTAFGPDAKCTRAQYMTFLYRAVGGQGSGSTASFSDVAADAYYADAVSWAVNNSVTNGTSNTTFSPDSPCVRAGMVTFLYRVFAK